MISSLNLSFVLHWPRMLSWRALAMLSCAMVCLLVWGSVETGLRGDSVDIIHREVGPTTLLLSGYSAEIAGPPLQRRRGCLGHWHDVDSSASWTVSVSEPTVVNVEIVAAVDEQFEGSTFQVLIGDQPLRSTLLATGGWEEYQTYPIGSVKVDSGELTVRLQPTHLSKGVFGNVRAVRLTGSHLAHMAAKQPIDLSGPIKVFTTSRYRGTRLSQQDSLEYLSRTSADATTIVVDPQKRFQTIEGFGGAFTEAAATVFSQLSPVRQQEVLRAYFDADVGHGYRLCRTHINSCDFSLGSYAYTEVEGDVDLKHFGINRDRQHLIPLIRAAQKVAGDETIKLLASPWSPPAWMKTNGQMTDGGKLKPECRDAWARYYCRYVEEYAKEQIDIWGLTVQNEPDATQRWESCLYSAEEERDFIRDYLGPTLHRNGLDDIHLIAWDHNRDRLFDRAQTVFDDPEAAKFVWGIGFHWYAEDNFHHVQMVHDFYPNKKLLFTEGCLEHGPHIGDWSGGERYARSIINDLNHGAIGWIDWNILLDASGGPNHAGNYCSAPILADVEQDQLIYNSSYYYLGHFAKFVRPGAERVLCANTGDELLTTAFLNKDGRLVVVVLNVQEYPIRFALKIGKLRAEAMSPEHSITTLVLDSTNLGTDSS